MTSPCQRWREGRAGYRRADEEIVPADYTVDVADRVARPFVERHHYSHTFPAERLSVGLWRGRELAGVAVFSVPMNNLAIPHHTGMASNAGAELGRFVLLDSVPGNGETWFLSRALRILRRERPSIETVLSYADPLERRTAAGTVVKPGHVGIIYQALSARYRGRTGARTAYWLGDAPISGRALSKIRLQETGADYAERQLRAGGAPARAMLEDPGDWLDRLHRSGHLRRTRHPGNHAYVFPLTPRAKAADRRVVAKLAITGIEYPKARAA